jgi:hypothetical protein
MRFDGRIILNSKITILKKIIKYGAFVKIVCSYTVTWKYTQRKEK